MHKTYGFLALTLYGLIFVSTPAISQEEAAEKAAPAPAAVSCSIEDRPCILKTLEETASTIENASWRDQTLRELAKTYAFEGDLDRAISFIEQIKTPDTKAMTIRGIGMAAADNNLTPEKYKTLFTSLRAEAEKIKHPPSYAIALTYIAMAQAFAGDDEGAWATAADMQNDALRHKAYGETAEIQAEKGNYEDALKSIAFIDSEAYKNKSYELVCKILADQDLLGPALKSAENITNSYKKAEALQYVLDKQKPREK